MQCDTRITIPGMNKMRIPAASCYVGTFVGAPRYFGVVRYWYIFLEHKALFEGVAPQSSNVLFPENECGIWTFLLTCEHLSRSAPCLISPV